MGALTLEGQVNLDAHFGFSVPDDEEYINLLVERVHEEQVISIVEAATQTANPMPTCDEVDPMDIDSNWDYFVDNVSGNT